MITLVKKYHLRESTRSMKYHAKESYY